MNNFEINPIKNKKTYLQILESLITLIANGKIQYGDKLYNENELMTMFQVSRPTLREALRVMEFLGIITVAPRKGIVINKPEDTTSYFPLIYILLYERTNTKNLFELFTAIQIEITGLAAEKGTIEDFLMLKKIANKISKNTSADYKTFTNLSYSFILQIAECSKNTLCTKMIKTLYMVMKIHFEQITRRLPPERRQTVSMYFSGICEAILNRNATEAQDIMRKYLKIPYKYLSNGNIINVF